MRKASGLSVRLLEAGMAAGLTAEDVIALEKVAGRGHPG
jgi:hypothetical protein